MPFIDETEVEVSSGRGGPGASTFRREKYVPRGGPDGGDGGHGGDVIFELKRNLKTLSHIASRRQIRAENGLPGQKRKRHGRDGKPAIIEVPPGTIIREVETGRVIKDMAGTQRWVFLQGGKGGRGNVWFKSSTRQAPSYAQPGLPGSGARIQIELNLIADIALVGFPNVGKSTLLSVLSNARPEIGAYPFTTKTPNLGVVIVGDTEFVVADIPGIVRGAAHGVGLGLKFLKHIRRSRALAIVIDANTSSAADDHATLMGELGSYDLALQSRPRLIVATKCDLLADGFPNEFLPEYDPVVSVSAHTHFGLSELRYALARMCTQN